MAEKSSSSLQTRGSAEDFTGESATNRKPAANHLLSCTNCRKRKVKCNKSNPCSACERSNLICVFPNRARLPRGRTGGSKTTNVELLRRVNKLEELLEKAHHNGKNTSTKPSVEHLARGRSDSALTLDFGAAEGPTSPKVEDEALDRYIGSHFWKNLTREVEGLRQTLNDVSDDEEDSPLPLESEASNSPVTRSARIFGIDVQKTRLRSLHPSQSQILMLCTFFVDNVDPIFKVMHVPTLKRSILDASSSLDNIIGGKSMEALLFAMYYAAVTSLTSEDCTKYFQEDRCTLLDRYRFATEVALANADILTSADMTTLQALVIFLICVRCHDDSQFSWTLIGVAIRIAYSLNLHREDIDTSLPPFALELRRRLWWQVCVLDIHASEDRGSDPMIHDFNFNTKMPLNINDADLDPESLQPLSDKACYTEMTFCRVGHDLSQLARRFNYLPPSEGNPQLSSKKITIEEKISVLKKRQEHIEKHYLAHCDLGYPLAWVATQIARLILSRMWLAIYHPLQPEYRSHAYPLTTRDDLLAISTNILELANSLEQEPTTAHWRWFFRSWVQWHALAVALAELCNQNEGTLVEKAWAIIDIIYEPWAAHIADSRNGMLWRPIQKLRSKAQANRQARSLISNVGNPRSTTTESMIFPSQQQLSYGNLQPSTFIPLSSETDLETERMLQAMMMQHQIGHHAQQQQQQDLLPPYPPQHPLFSSPLQSLPDYTTPPNPLPDFTTPQQTLPLFSSALGVVDQNMDTANWAQWDEFIQDFEMESRPGQRNPVQPLAEPFGSLWLP